ncbi:glycosyl transferase group 1 [Catenulispora acidiphila DSM 44928]|uniref:Glycosyl transferase group 1 n=1 Tax=Catenulispora acidiphila (strain DSM 44928 / JCM 14897 / NBRC 102108 / NRRL B-24433 / ID139908) TaxID=479433 RepID=C7Q6D3_CATAD|nr:glycosyltransferase family 4 protein [Catenulispora acidiphila]ACU72139.1 glycosyl transferase group 1 [Catenulispora acidiphila DSM 44928]
MSGPLRELTMTKEENDAMALVRATVPAPPRPASRSLRILMLSWEYPPVVVGGLGRHVHALARNLVRAGHQVTVATRHAPGAPLDEIVEGVRVVRAPDDPPAIPLDTPHLLAWTMAFNHTLTRAALHAADTGEYDLVHAHDWLVTHAAITMRDHLRVPLVATVHATEAGRHQGWLPGDLNRAIHSVECWLGAEAERVLVCSKYMGREVGALLGVPAAKTEVIPNGVDIPRWSPNPAEVAAARSRYAGNGPLIGFAGRLVYEKGVQHLLHAVPELRRRHPGLRVVIAGDGPQRGELEATAGRLDLHHEVSFTGFVPARGLSSTMASTDAMVVPSIYEPFGLVALEAAAAGAPLAVSETGGLAEIVEPGVTGLRFAVRDAGALTESVSSLISDREAARTMADAARTMVRERYGWDDVAVATAEVYAGVVGGARIKRPANLWRSPVVVEREPLRIPEGNLLESAGLLP